MLPSLQSNMSDMELLRIVCGSSLDFKHFMLSTPFGSRKPFSLLWMLRTLYYYLANDRTDGSGFMLDMGNLLWVATFYCLQARFLVSYPVILGPLGIAGVLGLKGLGYFIFRSANLQKDRFKADDPSVKG
jgi:delta14-sterol reductase